MPEKFEFYPKKPDGQEKIEEELPPEKIKIIMSKVFDINNFEGEVSVHNTTMAGLEHFLNKEEAAGDSWRLGLDGNFNSPPWSKFSYRGEKQEFNLDKALYYQELILNGNYTDVKINQKKIVSNEELDYLKNNPVISDKGIRNQNLNSMRIFKNAHEILTRQGWTLYSANIGIMSEHFNGEKGAGRRGHDYLFYGKGGKGRFEFNIRGVVVYDNRKINVEIISRILLKAYQSDLSEIVPVYSRKGDILWPQHMSYEEVKKFVAEKEKIKQAI